MEEGLNKDMTTPVEYLQNLCPQLSVGMTMWAAYHLKDRDAKRELNVCVDNKHLVFQQAALCTLACVSAKTLRISTRTLVFSVGGCCAPPGTDAHALRRLTDFYGPYLFVVRP